MTKSEYFDYKDELWGKIWEHIHWNEEEKKYQRFTNALFKAAKKDIIAEQSNPNEDNTKNLDKFIDSLFLKEKKTRDVESEPAIEIDKKTLKSNLLDDYNKLKQTLKEVRVFGIGNSPLQACANACKILLRTMVTVAILTAPLTISIALASTTVPAITVASLVTATAVGIGASIAAAESITPSLKLAATRNSLKVGLQEAPTKLLHNSSVHDIKVNAA